MKSVIQRVKKASVCVEGEVAGQIDWGLLIYLGIAAEDTKKDADWMAEKAVNLRIFNDNDGKMNISLLELAAAKDLSIHSGIPGVLAVSQFTLLGDAQKGRRPSWGKAAAPELAKPLYEYFIDKIRSYGVVCEKGVFQASMEVTYTNVGPVTLLLDSSM